MIGIYKITSPSGRIYIGQSVDIEKRINSYKRLDCKKQPRLYNSLLKYGPDNHFFEVVEECEIIHLNHSERYWQDYFDCLSNGLNCRLQSTSDKSGRLSIETKLKISKNRKGIAAKYLNNEERLKKISKSLTGKKLSDAHRKSLSISHMGLKLHPDSIKKMILSRTGLKMSDAFKNKMRIMQTGSSNSCARIVLNVNTGIFYETAKDAAESIGWTYNRMSHYMNGRTKKKLPFLYV